MSTVSRRVSDDRLLALAKFLETKVKPQNFDFSSWVGQIPKDLKLTPTKCNTTACALGWATAMPRFSRLGLRISGEPGSSFGYVSCGQTEEETLGMDDIEISFDSASRVFGVTDAEAQYLFAPENAAPQSLVGHCETCECEIAKSLPDSPGETATAKDLAKHIRNFVKARQARARA